MKTVVVILGILIGIAVAIFSFYGLFAPVNIQEKEIGPYVFVMKKNVGAYKDVGPIMDEMYRDLKEADIVTSRGLGIYYDDPKVTPENKTRSIIGRILDDVDPAKVIELEKKYPIGELPQANYLVVEFPFKGLPSIIIGIYRVYPKIARYMKSHEIPKMPIIEVYEPDAQKILYVVPIGIHQGVFDNMMDRLDNQG
jgi:DNA gyrase inhibitor GyrI